MSETVTVDKALYEALEHEHRILAGFGKSWAYSGTRIPIPAPLYEAIERVRHTRGITNTHLRQTLEELIDWVERGKPADVLARAKRVLEDAVE